MAADQTFIEDENTSAIALRSLDDITKVSKIFVHSGMFPADQGDVEKQIYQAVVKVMAGVEFGIQPFAAMRGINIIKGKAEMSANLMAAKVKKHPQYDYRVEKLDNDGCTLMFYELANGERTKLGESTFTREDADQAGLKGDNWTKFPRNMFFARAMSNGVRMHCPDVFYGAPVYVEGEVSGLIEEPATTEPAALEESATPPVKPEAIEAEVVEDQPDESDQDEETDTGDDQSVVEDEPSNNHKAVKWITEKQRKLIMALANEIGMDTKAKRLEMVSNEIGREIKSTNELTGDEAAKTIAAFQAALDAKKQEAK